MRAFAICLCFVLVTTPTFADQCDGKVCIDVSTESNQDVLITVKKSGNSSTRTNPQPTRRPRVKPSPTPSVWIPWAPSHFQSPVARPRPSKTARPRPRPTVKTNSISTADLMDQVRRTIPQGSIAYQPSSGILVHEPVYFRTSIPQRFTTVIVVLEIPIEIELTADYLWNFGDGQFFTTKDPGSSYPISSIRHSYSGPGAKEVILNVSWSGVWRSGAISGPIRGTINQRVIKVLTVETARARITQ